MSKTRYPAPQPTTRPIAAKRYTGIASPPAAVRIAAPMTAPMLASKTPELECVPMTLSLVSDAGMTSGSESSPSPTIRSAKERGFRASTLPCLLGVEIT